MCCRTLLLVIGFVLVGVKDSIAQFDASLGDICEKDGKPGVCKYIGECQSAINDIQKGIYPKICGFQGSKSIVCCPGEVDNKSTGVVDNKNSKPAGEKALEKCKEYAKYAWRVEEAPTLSVRPTYTKTLECAIDYEKLIVGGTKAKKMEFPHMVQVGYMVEGQLAYSCGGTIVSEYYVLTAAHCLNDRTAGDPKKVRVGVTNQTDLRLAQVRNVVEIISHPKYQSNRYDDIGLLRVKDKFEFNPAVRPACLYTKKTLSYDNAIACGWGKKGFTAEGSVDLLKVVLRFFSREACNEKYAPALDHGVDDETMVCAGNDHKDTCQGDSGGPLQVYHESTKEIKCMYDIVGVTSFGKACGLAKNTPGVYTRVSNYIGWIESIVWKD